MKIVNLVEDTAGEHGCLHEHGLSFYVETKKHKLLVDSGATAMFLHNAEVLGVDLTQVDLLVLSHGHYDHAGGIPAFAEKNPDASIYLHALAGKDYYHLSARGERYIGIDKEILNLPQVITLQGDRKIDDELFLFSGITGNRYPARGNLELKQKVGNDYVQDTFAHEQCLVITQGERHILMSGCAHHGILNIMDRYFELFHGWPDVVISGFHMIKKGGYSAEEAEQIRQTAYELLKTKALFYTGHCTGQAAFDMMKEIMGERLQIIHSGAHLTVPKG